MADPFNCYESKELLSFVEKNPTDGSFFADYLFPTENTVITDADLIKLARYTKNIVCAAPYTDICGPSASIRPQQNASEIGVFTPPMVNMDSPVEVCDAEEYRVDPVTGEANLVYADRMASVVSAATNNLVDRLRALKWVSAARIVVNGAYTISGENTPTQLIDFKRDPRLTLDLVASGGDTWDLSTTRPDHLIEQITSVMTEYNAGAGPFDVVFSPTAWKWYALHMEAMKVARGFQDPLDTRTNAIQAYAYVQYKGADASGQFRFWVINQKLCENGVEFDALPDGGIAILNRAAFNGRPVFATIKRVDGSIERTQVLLRDVINMNCDTRHINAKSRPMWIPNNINASAYIKVVDPALPLNPICYDGCVNLVQ
jgi:hypothetical protein